MKIKRVTLFAGHYGSGKTNIAVNYAMMIKRGGYPVCIADLDIVNPYFRTADSARVLEEAGIRLIGSQYANTNIDAPALPREMYDTVNDRTTYAVMDIGGDDRGALALGRYTPQILEENDYEMLFVANFRRPLTRNAAEALEVMHEIEIAGGIPFTGIINNTNLGELTDADVIRESIPEIQSLVNLSGLSLKFTSVTKALVPSLEEFTNGEIFPLTLQAKYY